MSEFIGILMGLVLMLFIYSYLIGDNPLYKIAVHILVGSSAAYAGVVVVNFILKPIYNEMRANPSGPNSLVWMIPFFFSLLILLQRLPSVAWLSQFAVAFMIGIGGAVALTGAVSGTLFPQVVLANNEPLFVGQAVISALLTAVTLLSFQFTQRVRTTASGNQGFEVNQLRNGVTQLGRMILTVTFGFLFAAILTSSLLVLTDRVAYFLEGLGQFVNGLGQLIQ